VVRRCFLGQCSQAVVVGRSLCAEIVDRFFCVFRPFFRSRVGVVVIGKYRREGTASWDEKAAGAFLLSAASSDCSESRSTPAG
jgi:hypothetical protein